MQLHTHGAEGDQKRQNNQRVEYLIDLESKQMVQTEIAGRRFGCLTSGCANVNKLRLFWSLYGYMQIVCYFVTSPSN